MPVDGGIEVVNLGGSTQVDQTYRALSFIGKGTTTVGAGGVTISANTPFVVCCGATAPARVDGATNNGDGTWTIFFASSNFGDTISWWAFDTNVPVTPHFFAVYDSVGALCFSSEMKLLTQADFLVGSLASVVGTHTYTSGHTYAGVFLMDQYMKHLGVTSGLPHLQQFDVAGFTTASNGITIGNYTENIGLTTTSGDLPPDQLTINALIADVTGL